MVETTVPAHPCAPAAPAFFSLRAKYSIEPGASVGQLAEDARCLIRTGLAALESYVMQHAVGVNHETVWAAVYLLRQGNGIVENLTDRIEQMDQEVTHA